MKKLNVYTESGGLYVLDVNDDGAVVYWENRGSVVKSWGLKNLDPDELPLYPEEAMWEYIQDQPWAPRPEVGKRLYLTGKSQWRISTVVVAIEEVHEE